METQDGTETNNTKKFTELLDELEDCNEDEQKQLILEMNSLIEEMNIAELISVFKAGLLDALDKMIEERKITLKNALVLLKTFGFSKELKRLWGLNDKKTLLSKKIEKMIKEEIEKKKEKNATLLTDLCECYIMLHGYFDSGDESIPIIMSCLLKAASNKEEENEAEMALFALCSFDCCFIKRELYLNEIKEIIQYNQIHSNLTRFAYQLAWKFLIDRLYEDEKLEEVIVNELYFVREAAKELEELQKCVNWKRKEEKRGVKETKEVQIIKRWLQTLETFFQYCTLWNKENIRLIGIVAQIFRASWNGHIKIESWRICLLSEAAKSRCVKVEELLKGGAIDLFIVVMKLPTLNCNEINEYMSFFYSISIRLKGNEKEEIEKVKRRELKKKVFEKMEEEGYEDFMNGMRFCFADGTYYYLLVDEYSHYFVYL